MNLLKEISLVLTDEQITMLMFILMLKYIPHFKNPRSLSEKINYIKLYNRNPLRAMVTDRLKVREYIDQIMPSRFRLKFTKILWHGVNLTLDIWNALPDNFVIKANHGSHMVKIVDKGTASFVEVEKIVRSWLKKDYTRYNREWIYKDLERYLVVEEKLIYRNSTPPDYKFFVCSGKVELVCVFSDRFENLKLNFYTRDFKRLDLKNSYLPPGRDIEKPIVFDEAVIIAEKLAVDFDFIRVDLYLLDGGGGVFFGELTNIPANGFRKYYPKRFDFELGAKLPPKIDR
jgi:hypothetical protein